MPIVREETYEKMWELSQEYREVLETFQDEWEIEVDEIYNVLEGDEEEVDEALDALQDVALIMERPFASPEGYFRITAFGDEVLAYGRDEKEEYLDARKEREESAMENYSS